MSYNHTTVGFEAFEGFVRALETVGIRPTVVTLPATEKTGMERLRRATFTTYTQRRTPRDMVVEEYLAVDDRDCDGISRVAIEVYPEGQRPDLESRRETVG